MNGDNPTDARPGLRRSLTLWDLILYGAIVLQPVAPMSVFGVLSDRGTKLVYSYLAGDFARRVPAHAIGDHEKVELLIDEEVVLVVVPLLADIRGCPELDV